MREKINAVYLLVVWGMFAGTTYVVQENGKEVGHYEENDGKTKTIDIHNQVSPPKPSAAVKPEPKAPEPLRSPKLFFFKPRPQPTFEEPEPPIIMNPLSEKEEKEQRERLKRKYLPQLVKAGVY